MHERFARWTAVWSLLWAVAPLALAGTTGIVLPAQYDPYIDRVVAREDGREFIITGESRLLPNNPQGGPGLFAFDPVTAMITQPVDLSGDVDAGIYSPPIWPVILSSSGRFIAFGAQISSRTQRAQAAVWLADRQTGSLRLVSRRADGTLSPEIDGRSTLDSMDRSARWITFSSRASDLLPGDTNGRPDVFLFDAQTENVERISVAADGSQLPEGASRSSISPDGQWVLVESQSDVLGADANRESDLYLLDRTNGNWRLVSRDGNGSAAGSVDFGPWSPDNRYFSFTYWQAQSNLGGEDVRSSSAIYDRVNNRVMSFRSWLDVGPDIGGTDSVAMMLLGTSPSSRYALVRGYDLLPRQPPSLTHATYIVDRQTRELARIEISATGRSPTLASEMVSLVGDEPRALFRNTSPELGIDPRTIVYDRLPDLADIALVVDGPRNSFPTGTTPRYTVQIANRGATRIEDLVYRVIVRQGNPSGEVGPPGCFSRYEGCWLGAIEPGQTLSYSFEIQPQLLGSDPAPAVDFFVRAQSAGNFDRAPPDNVVSIRAQAASSGGGGSAGGGGGGAFDLLSCLALLSLALGSGHRDPPPRLIG
jgi:hypothetical protein